MLFDSAVFLLAFLPGSLIAFRFAVGRGQGAAVGVLLVASVAFYAAWNLDDLALLCASIAVNYLVGSWLQKRPSAPLLALGVGANLALLGLFKYADLLASTAQVLFGTPLPTSQWALPLAISFYTFTQIAFVVDCHRGQGPECRSFADYALFVVFFPHLIAGPIVHHRDLMPQFRRFGPGYRVPAQDVARGLCLLIGGLFKKVAIADVLARHIDPAFAQVEALSFYDAWVATLGFALQLYFDFSAYSEIAMGVALLFGIRLPVNFDSPYRSRSIAEFWRRWHITLGHFLRDYLYVPLGGNRRGLRRTLLAAFATMLLGGLWHGAAWRFVLWGAVHGIALGIHALWRRAGIPLRGSLAQGMTFAFVVLAWVLFRADSLQEAAILYGTLFGVRGIGLPAALAALIPGLPGVSFQGPGMFGGLEWIPLVGLTWLVLAAPNIHAVLDGLRPGGKPIMALSIATLCVAFNLGGATAFRYWAF